MMMAVMFGCIVHFNVFMSCKYSDNLKRKQVFNLQFYTVYVLLILISPLKSHSLN